ncbi:hypothetical protein NLG97_g2939 [Lecanicillium saksenae]|uniref:Uncharacterized protein n=1 Tax=Lecanicillium saksenae TaxID=468837 RepID=A0ACC1R2S8_9HYPO|nr:hypothetical protein NLG97_g2939 [Lecanicillium saksenae]
MEELTAEGRCKSCEGLWQEAMQHSQHILGVEDFEFVQNFASVEQLLEEVQTLENKYANSFVPRILRGLRPYFFRMQYLITFLMISINSTSISYTCVWGATYLLLDLATKTRSEDALHEISHYLRKVDQNLHLFEIYREKVTTDPEIVAEFFDILVQILLNCAKAIKHFRKNDAPLKHVAWPRIQQNFTTTLEELSSRLDHVKKLVEARNLVQVNQSLDKLALVESGPRQGPHPPYYQLPFARNPKFFGRSKIMEQIREKLRPALPIRSINSVAVWGIGGIGKSQVALEYAHAQIAEQKVQVVLWLPAETVTELSNAIVEAVTQIKPPGFTEGDSPDKMRLVFGKWLQITDVPWLIIFDNVESNELLNQHWPKSGSGQVIVTCRSELIAASPAAHQFEVQPFGDQEAGELLLRLAGRPEEDAAERNSAEQIANLLGGLPLGIDIIARQIQVKKKSMQEFLPYFKNNKPSLRVPPRYAPGNPYYTKDLVTVWQTAFESLSDEAYKFLSIITFLAADGIPRFLLNPSGEVKNTWRFLQTNDDVIEELYYKSLIRINEDALSIHRLTKEAFYYFLSPEQKQEAFLVALQLLSHSFPKRLHGRHLYQSWNICSQLIHHVDALQEQYEELKAEGFDTQEPSFAILSADASWYCAEASTIQTAERIARRAMDNWTDRTVLQYAYLCESSAHMTHRRGRYPASLEHSQTALAIRKAADQTPAKVLADSHNSVALALLGTYQSEAAIQNVNRAITIARRVSDDERKTWNYDRYLRNRSRAQVALGLFDLAKADLDEAEAFQTSVYGERSHFHGETAYIRGRIAEAVGDLTSALSYFRLAEELQSPGKPTHQSITAARYHQACVLIRQGEDAQALECLQLALKIAEFNEPKMGDAGDSARVKLRIAEILRRQGSITESATFRAAAETTKLELEQTRAYAKAPDENQSWDTFCDLLNR